MPPSSHRHPVRPSAIHSAPHPLSYADQLHHTPSRPRPTSDGGYDALDDDFGPSYFVPPPPTHPSTHPSSARPSSHTRTSSPSPRRPSSRASSSSFPAPAPLPPFYYAPHPEPPAAATSAHHPSSTLRPPLPSYPSTDYLPTVEFQDSEDPNTPVHAWSAYDLHAPLLHPARPTLTARGTPLPQTPQHERHRRTSFSTNLDDPFDSDDERHFGMVHPLSRRGSYASYADPSHPHPAELAAFLPSYPLEHAAAPIPPLDSSAHHHHPPNADHDDPALPPEHLSAFLPTASYYFTHAYPETPTAPLRRPVSVPPSPRALSPEAGPERFERHLPPPYLHPYADPNLPIYTDNALWSTGSVASYATSRHTARYTDYAPALKPYLTPSSHRGPHPHGTPAAATGRHSPHGDSPSTTTTPSASPIPTAVPSWNPYPPPPRATARTPTPTPSRGTPSPAPSAASVASLVTRGMRALSSHHEPHYDFSSVSGGTPSPHSIPTPTAPASPAPLPTSPQDLQSNPLFERQAPNPLFHGDGENPLYEQHAINMRDSSLTPHVRDLLLHPTSSPTHPPPPCDAPNAAPTSSPGGPPSWTPLHPSSSATDASTDDVQQQQQQRQQEPQQVPAMACPQGQAAAVATSVAAQQANEAAAAAAAEEEEEDVEDVDDDDCLMMFACPAPLRGPADHDAVGSSSGRPSSSGSSAKQALRLDVLGASASASSNSASTSSAVSGSSGTSPSSATATSVGSFLAAVGHKHAAAPDVGSFALDATLLDSGSSDELSAVALAVAAAARMRGHPAGGAAGKSLGLAPPGSSSSSNSFLLEAKLLDSSSSSFPLEGQLLDSCSSDGLAAAAEAAAAAMLVGSDPLVGATCEIVLAGPEAAVH